MRKFLSIVSSQRTAYYFIIIFIALALTVTQFYFSKTIAETPENFTDRLKTFNSTSLGFTWYRQKIAPFWRTRIFSNAAASLFNAVNFNAVKNKLKNEKDWYLRFVDQVAAYNAVWLFATFVLCVFLTKNALFWIFGTFAAVCYAWTPAAAHLLYPWDGPSLFFWTFLVLCSDPKHKNLLPFLLMIGTGFKETVMVGAIIPLFWLDMPRKERIARFGIYLFACIMMKTIIDIVTSCPIPFLTMTMSPNRECIGGYPSNFAFNIHNIFNLNLNHPLFINGGTLVALFFLPNTRKTVMFKAIALVFAVSILVYGSVREYRIWHEMIPVFLYCFSSVFFREKGIEELRRLPRDSIQKTASRNLA